MHHANHKWLLKSPFISVSYPDVAVHIIRSLQEAGLRGLDRWQITELCPGVKPYALRTTLAQLESHVIILSDHRIYTLAGQLPGGKIIAKLNSTEARILGMLYEQPSSNPICTADVSARHYIERAQVRAAAANLVKRGFITQQHDAKGDNRFRYWYTLGDLNRFTLAHVVAEESESLIISK